MDIKGFPRGLAREDGKALLRRLDAVAALPEDELVGYPKGERRGPGRPPPELEATVDKLKAVRNQVAEELGLPRGTLLANAVIIEIARKAPDSPEAFLEVEGMRRWKAGVLAEPMLGALAQS